MGESIFKPIIIMLSFIAIALTLMTATRATQYSNASANNDLDWNFDMITGMEYGMYHPSESEGGLPITNATVHDHVANPLSSIDDAEHINGRFWHQGGDSGDRDNIIIQVVRNNTYYYGLTGNAKYGNDHNYYDLYLDLVVIGQNQGDWWQPRWKWAEISFDTIEGNHINGENASSTPFVLGKYNYTLFANAGTDNNTFVPELWWNNFTLYVGQLKGDIEVVGKLSMWALVGKILVMDIPGVHPAINFIIAFPIYIAGGYVIIVLVRSFIPTLGG